MNKSRQVFNTYSMVLCAFFSVLIATGAFIKLPLYPIPVTLQMQFVLLAGLMLGSRRGVVSVVIYILIGLLGVPVFALGGGLGYVLQPTFGYILGFVGGAYVTGRIKEKSRDSGLKVYLLASATGLLVIYITGMIYFYLIFRFYLNRDIEMWYLILNGFLITLPVHIVLGVAGSVLAKRLNPATSKYLSKQEN